MNAKVIGENLKRLRVARGLTQEALAAEAGISVPGYRNFEAGKYSPKVETMVTLSKALDVGFDDLMTERKTLNFVRFRALKKLKTREQILLDFEKRLEGYREVEEIVGETRKAYKPKEREPQKLAEEVRKELKLGKKAIVGDVCQSLEELGIKVIAMPCFSDGFFGLAVDEREGGPAVAVNTWDRIPVERWIFTAAHEAGHIFLHQGSFDSGKEDESDAEEKEASEFASYLLMPEVWFEEEWQQASGLSFLDRVMKLKQLFRVSYRTVLYRVQGRYSFNVWQMFYRQFKVKYGRSLGGKEEPTVEKNSDEPKRMEHIEFFEDRLRGLVRRGLEMGDLSRPRASEVLGLNSTEMGDLIEHWNEEKRA